jgi:hypothetical protein
MATSRPWEIPVLLHLNLPDGRVSRWQDCTAVMMDSDCPFPNMELRGAAPLFELPELLVEPVDSADVPVVEPVDSVVEPVDSADVRLAGNRSRD